MAMKYVPLFEQFVNESTGPIEIVYYEEVIDNWGRTESSEKPENILQALEDAEAWTDDMTFEDKGGRKYMIDDLIGKEVKVGDKVFTVVDPEAEEEEEDPDDAPPIDAESDLITLDELTKEWDNMYGEDFKEEYSGLHKELKKKYKMGFTIDQLAKEWKEMYGEDFKKEYKGLYKKLNESLNEGRDASSWTKEKLTKELKSLRDGAKENEIEGDDMAFDIADSWIADNPGVEKAIKKFYPSVSDFQGFVANWIA